MTITLTREEAQQAADALDGYCITTDERKQLVEALRARLAQPKPEPVAVVDANDEGYWADILPDRNVKVGQPLYTAPPQREWQRLTMQEIRAITHETVSNVTTAEAVMFRALARAIEAKLKEKNT